MASLKYKNECARAGKEESQHCLGMSDNAVANGSCARPLGCGFVCSGKEGRATKGKR